MQHCAEASGESSKEDNPKVTRSDQVPIGRSLLEVLTVDVKTQNRADGNDLRRESGCTCHEGDKEDSCGATLACYRHCRIGQHEPVADLRRGHSLQNEISMSI